MESSTWSVPQMYVQLLRSTSCRVSGQEFVHTAQRTCRGSCWSYLVEAVSYWYNAVKKLELNDIALSIYRLYSTAEFVKVQ